MSLTQLLQAVYPDLYRVDNLDICKTQVPSLPRISHFFSPSFCRLSTQILTG